MACSSVIARPSAQAAAKAASPSPSRVVAPSDSSTPVERELENIKQAVKLGKATESLLEMLEDAERQRSALLSGRDSPEYHEDDVRARLEKALAEIPEQVMKRLDDLATLLARHQVERGKEVLVALGTEVLIGPDGTAEIRGDLGKTLTTQCGSVAGAEGFEPPTSGFGDRRSAS